MKNSLKKAISILLVAVMVFGAAPLSGLVGLELPEFNLFSTKASAATYEGTCGDNLTWSLDTSTCVLQINGTGEMFSYTDYGVPPWNSYRAAIKTVIIGDNVTSIGGETFCAYKSLESVVIGNNVTKIGSDAFSYCERLTSVSFGENSRLNYIGRKAFEECIKLKSITIPDSVTSIDYGTFYNCDSLTSVIFGKNSRLSTIGDWAFSAPNLKNIVIPDTVKTIGSSAFYNCALTSVIIPDSVTSIGSFAFKWCDDLKSVTIGNGVKSITYSAFSYCRFLENVTIGNSVTTIDDYAFQDCYNLVSITIPASVKFINYEAFAKCYDLKDIYYGATKENWDEILIDSGNGFLTMSTINYNVHIHFHKAEVITSATCTQDGEMIYTCTCGDSYTKVIPQIPHTPSEWKILTSATCTENGTKVKECTVCGESLETEAIEKKSHIPGEWETVLAPTTEADGKKIKKCTACGTTVEEKVIEKITEPEFDEAVVPTPSQNTINYGDSIVLHVDAELIPENGYVEWVASNNNFTFSVSEDGTTCTISPSVSGDTTFTATVYDEDDRPVSVDEQAMTSKAGFFDKIIAFFKKLFGLTKTIPEAIKVIY